MVTVLGHGHLNVGGVTAGNLGLSHEESRADLATEQRVKPLPFLLLGAILGEDLHVTSVGSSTVDSLGSDVGLAQVFSHEAILEIRETSTFLEVVLRKEHIPDSESLGLLLQLLQNGWVAREAFLSGAVANLLLIDIICRNTFLLYEFLDLDSLSAAENGRLSED